VLTWAGRIRAALPQEETDMLIDHRTYTVKPGTMAKQMALYQEYGLTAQKRHLGEPLAYLITETGEVNTYIHIWVYKDAADRAAKRAAMQADPEWQVFMQKGAEAGYLIAQRNNLMNDAPFAPIVR
jgi:hypothetical protein